MAMNRPKLQLGRDPGSLCVLSATRWAIGLHVTSPKTEAEQYNSIWLEARC
jgi:hypothetical protein